MKNSLNKDILRDIKKSKGRFLSILFIVALGVAFFSGIKVSPKVMQKTADKYYDDYNFMDIRLLSTLGLTDDDVSQIRKIDGIKGVFPTYSMDVITNYKSHQNVLKVHALDLDNIKNKSEDYINQVKLIKGRLPQKSGECVLLVGDESLINIELGSNLKLISGNDDNLYDTLKSTEYKVVGYIQTPYYLSFEKGSTSIGDGKVNDIIMIPQQDFKNDIYTEVFLTVDNAREEDSFSDKYFDKIESVSNKLEAISDVRIEKRYDEVLKSANEELDKGKKELEDKKTEVYSELNKAENDLNKYKNEIDKAENILNNKKKEVSLQIQNGKKELSLGEAKLKQGYLEYEKGLKDFNNNKSLAEQGFSQAQNKLDELNQKILNLNKSIESLENKLKNEGLSEEEKNTINQELNKSKVSLNSLNKGYEAGKYELENKKKEFKDIETTLLSTKATLDITKEKLSNEKVKLVSLESKANDELKKGENEINKQKLNIKEAENKLSESKIKANEELQKADKKIKDSEDEIKKIEKPKWHILNRNMNYSYVEYASCADSIDALSKIFPVFFFSVAALVCLTTMTRMVDEQRINIGTLKALGYTTYQIARKYILYALSASLLGSILGIAIGYTVFPIIIVTAYKMMYIMPNANLMFDIPLAILVTLTSVSITTLAAYFACNKELKETPSILMRPRAPKDGKRIFLERVPFIWNKIGFIGKVTIRNIFRYKKRFLMTVLGIAGCSALILTGLGIRDSIQIIVDGQYGYIFKYDMSISLDNDIKDSEIESLKEYIGKEKNISNYQFIDTQNGKIALNKKQKDINIIIPSDTNEFKNIIGLKDRKTQRTIDISGEGVVLSEKLSNDLGIKVGDIIEISNSKEKTADAKVVAITENYLSHYAYMSKEYYKKLFNRDVDYNKALGILSSNSKINEEELSKEIVKNPGVSGVEFNTSIKDNFENMIDNLKYVVLIMTVSAGALAFVVLYNLTNVNISERNREIATIKVLGFYDNEVSAYIYRENIILTLIGTFIGLGLGKFLHQFIMITVELENMMFGRNIQGTSYIIAAGLTIFLGLIVNLAMYYKLKNVEMIESLKSVD